MVKLSKNDLYERFETGDIPSEQDFKDLIDSTYNDESEDETLKILMIGNSFSDSIVNHLRYICASAKVNVIVGTLFRSGESLQGHWEQISLGGTYTYYKHTSLNGAYGKSASSKPTLLQALSYENWDYVFYQQSSALSNSYSSFNPYLPNLIQYVKDNTSNNKLKHGLHMTWAYASNYLVNNGTTQTQMHEGIVNAYKSAMKDNVLDLVIPSGTAIQNARTNTELQALNNDLTTDSMHLGPAGEIIGAMVFFESLLANKYKKDIFTDVTYTVSGYEYYMYLAKIAAKNASINPFKVTNI